MVSLLAVVSVFLIGLAVVAALQQRRVSTSIESGSASNVETPAWVYPIATVEPGNCLPNTLDLPWNRDRLSEFSTRIVSDDREGWSVIDPDLITFVSAFIACAVAGEDAAFATYLGSELDPGETRRAMTAGLPDPAGGTVTVERVQGLGVSNFGHSGMITVDLACTGSCISTKARLFLVIDDGPPYVVFAVERRNPR